MRGIQIYYEDKNNYPMDYFNSLHGSSVVDNKVANLARGTRTLLKMQTAHEADVTSHTLLLISTIGCKLDCGLPTVISTKQVCLRVDLVRFSQLSSSSR